MNIILLLGYLLGYIYSMPMEELLGDPASLYGFNQFTGFFTFMGVIILAIGIGAVFLMLAVYASRQKGKGICNSKEILALLTLSAISLFFILDDLFLFHERIFTGLLQVGERRIFLLYILVFSIVLIVFRKEILSGPTIFFLVAGLFFALSIAADVFSDKVALSIAYAESVDLLEEGGKLGGYLFWTAFIFLRARACVLAEKQ
jgi:hypothetical protein